MSPELRPCVQCGSEGCGIVSCRFSGIKNAAPSTPEPVSADSHSDRSLAASAPLPDISTCSDEESA
jgi:hypothetical protein